MNPDDPAVEFSAWPYAEQRCKDVAKTPSRIVCPFG
jgi:hypothetical protein